MTNPVVLLGTQSNGETLPVQVDATGRLVAEGLPGEPGEQGPEGPPGPPGQDIELPPDPYEGALLGWLNGGLAWVGAPPIIIPDYVFGPIASVQPDQGLMEVQSAVPSDVLNGVYLEQCTSQGRPFVEGWNFAETWSDDMSGALAPATPATLLFDGDLSTFVDSNVYNDGSLWSPDLQNVLKLEVYLEVFRDGNEIIVESENGIESISPADTSGNSVWLTVPLPGNGKTLKSIYFKRGGNGVYLLPCAIKVNDELLADRTHRLQFRVNQVLGTTLIGSFIGLGEFSVGQYLMAEEQRVAPWVLYGNDPTSRIDLPRQS